MIAAAVLALLLQSDAELVRAFLDSRPGAERALLRRGTAGLHATAAARLREHASGSYEKLLVLHWQMKRLLWESDAARSAADKLESTRLENTGLDLEGAVGAIMEHVGVTACVDPGSDAGPGRTRTADPSLRSILDAVTAPRGLDYDWRYGVLWIAEPRRLWVEAPAAALPALTAEQEKAVRASIAGFSADAPDERERATADVRRVGVAATPLLEEGSDSANAEIASRCKSLLAELRPRVRAWPLPAANRWTRQDLSGDDKTLAARLRASTVSMHYRNTTLQSVLKFLGDEGNVTFDVDPGAPFPAQVNLLAYKLPVAHALELVTIPYGLDAKIERGVVVIVAQEK